MSNTFKEVVNIFSTKYNSCFKSKYVENCLKGKLCIEIPFCSLLLRMLSKIYILEEHCIESCKNDN